MQIGDEDAEHLARPHLLTVSTGVPARRRQSSGQVGRFKSYVLHVAALVCVAGLLVACDDDKVWITDRAVAAVALQHAPGVTDMVRGQSVSGGTDHGAFLQYRIGGGALHEELSVSLFERGSAPAINCAEQEEYGGCEARAVEEGTVTVAWVEETPHEDPGRVTAELVTDDRIVEAIYSGPRISGDPRMLEMRIPVGTLERIVRDDRLEFATTQATVQAGKEIPDWGVQRHPDHVPVSRVH